MNDPTIAGGRTPLPLHPDQIAQAAGMLARAFQDDVLPRFLYVDAERRRQYLPALFTAWLRDGLRRGEVRTLGPTVAVAIWLPPHAMPLPETGASEVALGA